MRIGPHSGFALIREIRKQCPATRIIATTAYASIESALAAMRLGVTDYFPKPVTVAQIVSAFGHGAGAVSQGDSWMQLDDARRCYIEDTLDRYGSLSTAARVLGLDRRSLRRMLVRFDSRVRDEDPAIALGPFEKSPAPSSPQGERAA
jgi:two-component system response regulator RegA